MRRALFLIAIVAATFLFSAWLLGLAHALDPNLAEITEVEALRSTVIVQKTMIDAKIRDEAIQRAYVLKLERAVSELETKLSLTEKAMKSIQKPDAATPPNPGESRGGTTP